MLFPDFRMQLPILSLGGEALSYVYNKEFFHKFEQKLCRFNGPDDLACLKSLSGLGIKRQFQPSFK